MRPRKTDGATCHPRVQKLDRRTVPDVGGQRGRQANSATRQ
ncbi:hypothetical protein CSHISOI_10108 [Colletotrichum shisoi]|uniref:Uncharacterized protein n=1 Tax=Colletotrichum shisoi TaxID=2078593 RepID=A0A5Q4BEY9_9PEZI|nr:hypothetical protein CSHISOI_10108 [Colletotrichum shisoi]